MDLIHDTNTFAPAARELAVRFIQRAAVVLHQAPEVDFDVADHDAAQSDLLFNICFFGVAEFEEQSGIDVLGVRYTPRVSFEPLCGSAANTILIGNTLVHGQIEQKQLAEGVTRARDFVKNKALSSEN